MVGWLVAGRFEDEILFDEGGECWIQGVIFFLSFLSVDFSILENFL